MQKSPCWHWADAGTVTSPDVVGGHRRAAEGLCTKAWSDRMRADGFKTQLELDQVLGGNPSPMKVALEQVVQRSGGSSKPGSDEGFQTVLSTLAVSLPPHCVFDYFIKGDNRGNLST